MTSNIKKIVYAGLICCCLSPVFVSCGDNDIPLENLDPAFCPATIEFNLPDNLKQLVYRRDRCTCTPIDQG